MASQEYFIQLARSQEVYDPLPQLPQESLGTDESEYVANSLQGLKSLRFILDEALKKYTRKTQASTTEVLWSNIRSKDDELSGHIVITRAKSQKIRGARSHTTEQFMTDDSMTACETQFAVI